MTRFYCPQGGGEFPPVGSVAFIIPLTYENMNIYVI